MNFRKQMIDSSSMTLASGHLAANTKLRTDSIKISTQNTRNHLKSSSAETKRHLLTLRGGWIRGLLHLDQVPTAPYLILSQIHDILSGKYKQGVIQI